MARHAGTPEFETFRVLVDRTPELRDFGRRAWTQHAAALADTITRDAARRDQPVDPAQAHVLARFVLESLDLASVSPDPGHTLAAGFTLLRQGWPASQDWPASRATGGGDADGRTSPHPG